MDQCTHEIRAQHWQNIIMQCQQRPAGQSTKQWLKDNGICEQSYYHWQRKFRQKAYEDMKHTELPAVQETSAITFAEFKVSESSSQQMQEDFKPVAVIRSNSLTIALANDISDSLLNRILQVVSHA